MKFNHDNADELATGAAMVLTTHPLMVIATVDKDGQPWAVPVHQKTSPNLEITWLSMTNARHSQNIVASSKVSATLFSVAEHGEVSLFLEGTAAGEPPPDEPDAARIPYKMTPTAAWINDDTHTKTAVDLELLRTKLNVKENK
jgi:predicted pyridoxine 5'-phosphate oxidase superfamily flavin-nucleotide-binding protein